MKRTRSCAADLTRDGIELGRGVAISMALYALATLELGLGRYEAALDRGLDTFQEDPFFRGTLALFISASTVEYHLRNPIAG